MKKKKSMIILTSLLIIGLTCSTVIRSKAAEISKTKVVCSKSTTLCKEVKKGYNDGEKGPMMIVKGILSDNNIETEVYLVTLSGTENVDGQSTNWTSDFQSAFELESDYKKNVRMHMLESIPENSNVILAGHSLGGMIAQQIASDKAIKKQFNVLRTITFGSPLVSPFGREGKLKRFVDSIDVVPHLSLSNVVLKAAKVHDYQVNYAVSGYTNVNDAHQESYVDNKVWARYDFLGNKNGDAKFTFYKEDKEYFKCPVFED